MSEGDCENEGFLLLEEFVCDAIPATGGPWPPSDATGRTRSEPVEVLGETRVEGDTGNAGRRLRAEEDLRQLPLDVLLELVGSGSLRESELRLVRQIAEQRAEHLRAQASLADQLLSRCQGPGRG